MFLKGRAASVRLFDTNEIVKHFFPVKLTSLSSVYVDKGLQACKWIFSYLQYHFSSVTLGKPTCSRYFNITRKKRYLLTNPGLLTQLLKKFPLQ